MHILIILQKKAAYSTLRIPGALIRRVLPTAAPLLINEILWSLGMTLINQLYSSRGLNAVAALNMTGTAWNLFCVIISPFSSTRCPPGRLRCCLRSC